MQVSTVGRIVLLLLCFSFAGCLFGGKPPSGNVRSYRDGIVSMTVGSYHVGPLASSWQRLSLKQKTLAFRVPSREATIATNAFCGENFDDAPLEVLTRHLYAGVDAVKVVSQTERMLDGRRSLATIWTGRMDGVDVKLEGVSTKNNNCLFDFYYIAFPNSFDRYHSDFESFVGGFSYP